MSKKRDIVKSPSLAEKDFINGAHEQSSQKLNPKAPRKYKTHTIPMNEFEYDLLTQLAEKYGQTHNGIIRFALKKLSEE